MKDILKDKSLKKMPYSIPEGYFEGLKDELKMIPGQVVPRKRFFSWTWAAAAVLIATGAFFIGRSTSGVEFTEEDYIVFSDDMTDIMSENYPDIYAEANQMTEDDIVEYLIDIGVEIEEFEE